MCWHSHGWRWEQEPERTAKPTNSDDLRIADADRERAVAQLSKHAGDGRLTLDEFEERVGEVYAARTNGDLRPVFRGLPPYAGAAPTRPRLDVEHVVRPLVMVALFALAVFTFGTWVLWIGLWFIVPRLLWGGGRHGRPHRVEHDRRDEELTSV